MNFIVLQPRITKDFILSKINQESIMQYYTGQDVNSKKLYTSVLRADRKVTCGYYKSKSGVLYLHDFATNEHLDCWNVVMRLYNCNFYKALDIIAKDFNLIDSSEVHNKVPLKVPSLKETESAKIQVQIKDFTEEELKWWKSFGISVKTLKKFHVFSLKHVFLNGELKFTSSSKCPIYGYYFGKDKNKQELWKIYFPMNKEKGIRFINNLSKKILQGYHQLPETGNLLVITKSMKDVMTLYEFGVPACAPQSEVQFLDNKQLQSLESRFRHIVILFDLDKTGIAFSKKIKNKYPNLLVTLLPRTKYCKDISDFYKKYGHSATKNLILDKIEKCKKEKNIFLNFIPK